MKKQQVAQAFFERGVKRILTVLLLTEYTVTFQYESGLKCTMEIKVDHQYLTGKISYGSRAVKMFMENPDEAFETLVHECVHILTSRLSDGRIGLTRDKYLELEESTTEHIAQVVHRLMRRL